jgi:hypothetical protein
MLPFRAFRIRAVRLAWNDCLLIEYQRVIAQAGKGQTTIHPLMKCYHWFPGCPFMTFRHLKLSVLVLLLLCGYGIDSSHPAAEASKPAEISRSGFAGLIRDLSEPEGYFDTDNFISNEKGYLKVLPLFAKLGAAGGAYLGVGPDQNFSYIAELRPEIAVIIDIRRQNQIEHLFFKALFELSPSREISLQRLFGRRLPGATESRAQSSITSLMDEIEASEIDRDFARESLRDVDSRIGAWHLDLQPGDLEKVEYTARAFIEGGPGLRFRSYNRPSSSRYPTCRSLFQETDSAGRFVNYLASEERYQRIRALQLQNRIIPVVGNLAGKASLRRIADEIRARKLEISCFYLSNVEFYLFGDSTWKDYVANMQNLPWSARAILIRSVSNNWRSHPASLPDYYMTTILQRAAVFLENEKNGRHSSYWNVVTSDYIAP